MVIGMHYIILGSSVDMVQVNLCHTSLACLMSVSRTSALLFFCHPRVTRASSSFVVRPLHSRDTKAPVEQSI